MTIGADSSPARDHVVEPHPGLLALAVAEPADARRQPLEGDPLLGGADPAVQVARCRGTARARPRRSPRCRPGRRTARPTGTAPCPRRTAAGCRPGTKPGIVEGPREAALARLGAERVAVVEHLGAGVGEPDHRLDSAAPSTRGRAR